MRRHLVFMTVIVTGALFALGVDGESSDDPAGEPDEPEVSEPTARDLDAGRNLFAKNCAGCHGDRGHGVENRGLALRTSEFVRGETDDRLVSFIKRGRSRANPKSKTGAKMPSRGGNPILADEGVRDIVAFLRVIQQEAAAEGEQMPHPIPVLDR